MENQNTEWKESWRDEYLKWICGFANAKGGHIDIGRNDDGKIVGISDAKRLLEELPNKIRSTMGIVATINLLTENGLDYISIDVPAHPNAISYRGKYYLRSGSTNQELSGFALDELILRKYGRTWDSAPILHVTADDLDIVAFREFRKKSLARGRLSKEDLDISDAQLLETLKLVDGQFLKRAAILCFHEDPEKWVTGAYVKIGYFRTDDDLVYQDEIHGSLITMPDKVIDTLYTKYFKGIISYEGIQRVETYPVNIDTMREAILNAIVHKDYASGNPIQIRVYDNKVTIFNNGKLPADWSVEKLMEFHTSDPHNPNIANTFFRSGMTEAWGRGIEKIVRNSLESGKPKPSFETIGNGLRVIFNTENIYSDANDGINIGINDGIKLTDVQKDILKLMEENPKISAIELSDKIGITPRNVEANISKLKNFGIVERTGSKKNGEWVIRK
jgi:ATP-dependent DNA helicase RecG